MNLDSAMFRLLIFGLVLARVGFVLSYRQQYGGDILRIFDVRDDGFLVWCGCRDTHGGASRVAKCNTTTRRGGFGVGRITSFGC